MTESTTYDPENELKVIVHGWLGSTQEKEGLCSYNKRGELGRTFVILRTQIIIASTCHLTILVIKLYATHISSEN